MNNPTILKLYAHHRCFTDAHYPGRAGVEIRTIENPLGFGKNALLFGGTDFPHVESAVIGFHRSFADVTVIRDDVLCIPRLNFAVSASHCSWKPTGRDGQRIIESLHAHPETRLDRAADFGLFYYQTDLQEWADVFERVVSDCFRGSVPSRGAWKLALAWALIESSPIFTDAFRVETDRFLLSLGEFIATELENGRPSHEPLSAQTSRALALHRIGDHFARVYGENPFDARRNIVQRTFAVAADALQKNGEVDWLAVDQWVGYLFEIGNYEPLDDGTFWEMTAPIFEKLSSPTGCTLDEEARRHAANVMLKAAAFEDDGRFLWIRRELLAGLPETTYPADRPVPSWNWYTGAYAPDLVPVEPRDVPHKRAN